jgi:glycine/D-amino acid oxidase-like deaminating enzyme
MTRVNMNVESPLWSLTAPAFEPGEPLTGKTAAKVVVIGAGFLGLSTALHLAEQGIETVVVESLEPGAGASGRNTGFVIPHVQTPNGPGIVRQSFGDEAGTWLVRNIGNAGNVLFDLVKRLDLDCQAQQVGWVQAAHSPEMAETLGRIGREWGDEGFPVDLLDADGMESALGFRGYIGGLRFRSGGQINPLAYVRGLAAAAVAKGAKLYCYSPVTRIEAAGDGWLVSTPQGDVTADRVVVAANAGLDGLLKVEGDEMRLSHMRQSATFVLPESAPFKGASTPFSDTSPHPNIALRRTMDGRMLTGGPPELAKERLATILPAGQKVEIEHTWGGNTVHSDDLMPRFEIMAPGLFRTLGCNGRGVAMATMLGTLFASYLADPESQPLLPKLHH